MPSPEIARVFTLVSKTVQNLGNLNGDTGAKELWMRELNENVVVRNRENVMQFLDAISTSAAPEKVVTAAVVASCSGGGGGGSSSSSSSSSGGGRVSNASVVLARVGSVKGPRRARVILEGSLTKRGMGRQKSVLGISVMGRKNFKRRHFVLDTDGLRYHHTKTSNPIFRVRKEDMLAVEPVAPGTFELFRHMFQVVQPKRTLYVCAHNASEARRWIHALRSFARHVPHRLSEYHPGVYRNGSWSCCLQRSEQKSMGCMPTSAADAIDERFPRHYGSGGSDCGGGSSAGMGGLPDNAVEPDLRRRVLLERLYCLLAEECDGIARNFEPDSGAEYVRLQKAGETPAFMSALSEAVARLLRVSARVATAHEVCAEIEPAIGSKYAPRVSASAVAFRDLLIANNRYHKCMPRPPYIAMMGK